MTQAHQKALDSLTSKAEGLEKSLSSLETKRAAEAKQLAVSQKEADLLRNQLRSAGCTGVSARGPAGRRGLSPGCSTEDCPVSVSILVRPKKSWKLRWPWSRV